LPSLIILSFSTAGPTTLKCTITTTTTTINNHTSRCFIHYCDQNMSEPPKTPPRSAEEDDKPDQELDSTPKPLNSHENETPNRPPITTNGQRPSSIASTTSQSNLRLSKSSSNDVSSSSSLAANFTQSLKSPFSWLSRAPTQEASAATSTKPPPLSNNLYVSLLFATNTLLTTLVEMAPA